MLEGLVEGLRVSALEGGLGVFGGEEGHGCGCWWRLGSVVGS